MTIQSLPYTLLSLPRWAQIIGINPVHFQGAEGGTYWPVNSSCSGIWPRHPWQTVEEFVSREDVVRAILQAESDIKRVLGYSPAPVWECEEVRQWNTRGNVRMKQVSTQWGKIISGGARATTAIEEGASVVYSDDDGDGWSETATVTVASTVSLEQVKVYFAGTDASPDWEIRPTRKSSSSGTITIELDSWVMIDPELQAAFPTTGGFSAIDISGTGNFVTEVDVYREYTDTTTASARFYWPCSSCNGTGCPVCQATSQDGVLMVENSHAGIVYASPATYDTDNSHWDCTSWTYGANPNYIKLWYQAGEIANDFLRGYTHDPLSSDLANAIAWMAAARLEKPVCECTNVQNVMSALQRDLTRSQRGDFYTRFPDMEIFSNPFGTRTGEVRAWAIVNQMRGDQVWGAGVL